MCGIAGYINLNNREIDDSSRMLRMLAVQKHRGPDDSGIRAFSLKSGNSEEVSTQSVSSLGRGFEGLLGFNRLSILDLSENGHQPMVSPDESVILMLNGELYNVFDYKSELENWGHKFRSTSDTEVALALYLKYGFDGMLERLNGMFAIVVADLKEKKLFITRDRFGIKPMYIVDTGETFAFSSELKSFKYLDNFNFQLDHEKLDEFLIFRNNLEGTLFRNIQSLEPGHYIEYKHGERPVVKKFFDPENYQRSKHNSRDINSFGREVESWLDRSVKRQLMSDVKLGCQLSGGVDSSLVTWLANKNSDQGSFESVSIVFGNSEFSEEKYIDQVADQLNIVSHKFLLDASYYLENIKSATWHLETPINHPNTIGIYRLSQLAREHVTVLLSGEGADEVFGGYSRFYGLAYPYRPRKLLHQMKKNLATPAGFLRYFDNMNRAVMATSYMMPTLAGKLYSGFNFKNAISSRESLYSSLSGSLFDRQVKYELKSFLPDLLIRQDKMSMAHSIENRVPFLDNEVVDNSFMIPEKMLLLRRSSEGMKNEKYLLKKLTAEKFGNEFAFRDKMGFGIPVRDFFQQKSFQEYLNEEILPGIKERGIFNDKPVSDWLSDIKGMHYTELDALWVIVAFEIWATQYLDGENENWNSPY